jgi:hypothetical protein
VLTAEQLTALRPPVVSLPPTAPAANVPLALRVSADPATGRPPADQPAAATGLAQAFSFSALVTGAQATPPSAPLTLSADASPDGLPAEQSPPLALEVPSPAARVAEQATSGPLAVPALAGLLTPVAAWAGPGPFRLLRRVLPQAQDAGRDLTAALAQFLRSPWVAGTTAALATLHVLRRRARRRAPVATELPEITGPRGL